MKQEKKILQPGIEFLELEELQGVSGLRALRVGVKVETEEGMSALRAEMGRVKAHDV